MLDTHMTIKMIETAINKGIRDIEDNPKRGIRNLVDLANHFASSPFQKNILKLMQTMLANLNSPYYNIVSYLINNVDHNTIKTFGINLGYKSWTYGARKIREHEKTHGYSVPWTIVFDFREETESSLNNDDILHIIEQGKEIGIYTYMFFMNNIDNFSDIIEENTDCAFVLYIPSNILTEENISKISSYNNTVFSILYDLSIDLKEFNSTVQLLRNNRCLFGLHSYYGDDNIEYILNNRWVDDIVSCKSAFGFLIESKNCNEENARLIHEYVFNSKIDQKHLAFLIDLYKDIAKINKNISANSCILSVTGSEDVYYCKNNKYGHFNIKNMSLTDILLKSKEE